MKLPAIHYHTLGCKSNQYDTGVMEHLLTHHGHPTAETPKDADVIIINSCTVTAESDRKTRQTTARMHRNQPNARIIVCGCSAQKGAAPYLSLPGVAAVLGTQARARIVEAVALVLADAPPFAWTEMQPGEWPKEAAALHRARGVLKIQDGCDRHCTYCIIPTVRGAVQSRPLAEIGMEAVRMANAGIHEIVLTGIRLMAYDADGADVLDAAQTVMDHTPAHVRVRLGSLDPDRLDAAFMARAAGMPRLCPHFHLSLQSGSDGVLQRMGRRYDTAYFLRVVQDIRRAMPDAGITADILTGFVGETQAQHEETLSFVEQCAFSRIHVFPYSRREGTAAARMQGHLPHAVKQARCRELIALGDMLCTRAHAAAVGKDAYVIFESQGAYGAEGYAENYLRICTQAPVPYNVPVRVSVTHSEGQRAMGSPTNTEI